jgi:hypothetical protein
MITPQALSEVEVREVAELIVSDDIGFGCENIEEALEYVRSYPIAKFPKYTTDGPGYSGEIFVIVGGILRANVIYRDRDGKLRFSND